MGISNDDAVEQYLFNCRKNSMAKDAQDQESSPNYSSNIILNNNDYVRYKDKGVLIIHIRS